MTKRKSLTAVLLIIFIAVITTPVVRLAMGQTDPIALNYFMQNSMVTASTATYAALLIDDILMLISMILIAFSFCTITDAILFPLILILMQIAKIVDKIENERKRNIFQSITVVVFITAIPFSLGMAFYIMACAQEIITSATFYTSLMSLSAYTFAIFLAVTAAVVTIWTSSMRTEQRQ